MFIIILILFDFISQSSQHQHKSNHLYCKSDFTSIINKQSKLQVGNDLIIEWNFEQDDSIDIQIYWNKLTWLGIGFCPTMFNCDMVIFNLIDDYVQVLDMFSRGYSNPKLDNHNDIIVIEQKVNSNGYMVKFNRKLSTGDPQDQILIRNQKHVFSYAYSYEKQLAYHNYYAQFDIYLEEGLNDSIQLNQGSQDKILLSIHAIILFMLWGIVADFGIIIVRFAKERDNYLKIHTYCFGFINILTIIIFIIMITQYYNQQATKIHLGLSILMLIFLFIQSLNGLYVKSKIEPFTHQTNSKFLKLWKAHILFGTLIYIVAKIEIIIGLVNFDSPILLGLTIGWFILLIILRIILERRRNLKKKLGIRRKYYYIPPAKLTDQQQLLLTLLNQNIPTIEINQQLPNLIWVIMDNNVFDFSTYQHPAGNFLIEQGKEIGRYFYGGISLESTKIKKHNHSPMAYDMMDARYIGTLVYNFFTIDQSIGIESVWTLAGTTKFTYDISLFEFKSTNLLSPLEINVNNMGQYFTIQLINDKRKRQYTQILCMRIPYQQFKTKVLQFYHSMHLNTSQPPKLMQEYSKSIPLIIKRYNYPKAVTPHIFDLQNSEIVYLEGPFGRGLELKKSMKAVAFVGGTGLLPFLDLLDHLLMKSIYAVLKKTNDQKAEQLFNKNSQLGDDFEFSLNGTFLNEEEFIGREWIRQLYKINQENNLKFFNMQLRYSNGKLDDAIPTFQNRFSQEFVLKELGDFSKQVYICGPPSMNYSLLQIINQSQQNQEKVMIV